jgi:acyl-CoA reductase-like NAD-dependent aldehyde dehydrogenase
VLTGGAAENGLIRPTVLADVRPEMKLCVQEVFGPVVRVSPYDSLE